MSRAISWQSPGGSGNGSNVFVFQPGGVAAGNVYTDWATMMAACDLVKGLRYVEIDTSFGAATVAVGTWDFTDVVLTGGTISDQTLAVVEGVVFTNLRHVTNLFLTWNGLTPPVTLDGTNGSKFIFDKYSGLTNLVGATGPFFDIPSSASSPDFPIISLEDASQLSILQAGQALINLSAAASNLIIIGVSGALPSSTGVGGVGPYIANDVISGVANSDVYLVIAASTSKFSTSQAAFNGNLHKYVASRSRYNLIDNAGVSNALAGDLFYCDPATSGGINLPKVSTSFQGAEIVIKNTTNSAVAIVITPDGADTIDGVAGAYSLTAAFGSLTLVGDGVSNWMKI